jgi:membrane-anchored protein YejM (alkaline phosphatase superfamily)
MGVGYLLQVTWYNFEYFVNYQNFCLLLFVISSYVSHLALLSLWPLLIMVPMLGFFYFPRLIISVSLFIAIFLASLLLIDVYIYSSYRFHLNGIIVRFLWNASTQNVFSIARGELIGVAAFIFVLSCLEYCYAIWLWRLINNKTFVLKGFGRYGLVLAIFFYISYSSIFYVFYSVLLNEQNVTRLRLWLETARVLPGYIDLLGLFVPKKYTELYVSKGQRIPLQFAQMNLPLKYPLNKLVFESDKKPINVVVIVSDAWRFDAFNDQVTPNIYRLGKKSWVFSDHVSGGNATGPGIFSLFYGIPATYWTAMESQYKSPVLLDTLQNKYDVKVISSGELFSPPLNETVFQRVPDLQKNQQPGLTPKARDEQVTQQFKLWIDDSIRLKKPFFTFLFYDSTHSYCEAEYQGPFNQAGACNRLLQKDKKMLLRRYKNAAYFVDQQVQEVITALERKGLLKNTIMIITADHGEEFDDNHLGFWGHGSNYTPYQIKVPLIVYWPGEQPQKFMHRTSHFDIVPTLMTRLLGCKTKLSDYTVGVDLLDRKSRFPLIISSYVDFGIFESNQTTRVYSTGGYQIEKYNGKITHSANINVPTMQSVFKDFTHFNQ